MRSYHGETMRHRRPKNQAEAEFYDFIKARGWEFTRRGAPDFFCFKDGQILLVEIKPKKDGYLRPEQLQVMHYLAQYGVPCYFWSPDTKEFQQVN